MVYIKQRITVINIRKPESTNVNAELQWLGSSLGLINLRDKDKSCFRIFIELLKHTKTKERQALTSDEIAYLLNLSRGTVVHHLNKLMESGLVINERNRYLLRVGSLHALVDEIEKDMHRSLLELRQAAEEIDRKLGF